LRVDDGAEQDHERREVEHHHATRRPIGRRRANAAEGVALVACTVGSGPPAPVATSFLQRRFRRK
jgi:hypothetical protein